MGAPGQRPLMLLAASLWCFMAALPTARAFDRAPPWKSVARVLPSSPPLSPPFDERFETWFFEWLQDYSQEEVAEIACNMLRCLNDMFDLDSFIAAMNASHSLRTDSSTASTGVTWPSDTINGERVSGADLPIVISIGDPASGTNSNAPRSSAKLLDVDRVDNAPATNEDSATLRSSIRNTLSSLFSNPAERKTEVGGESTMSTPLSPPSSSSPPPSAALTTSAPEPLSQRTTPLLSTSLSPPSLSSASSLSPQLSSASSSLSPPLSPLLLSSSSSPMLSILSPPSLSQPLTPSSLPSSSESPPLSSQPPLPAVLLLSTAPPPPLAPPPPPPSSSLPPLPPKLPTPSSPAPPSSSSFASKSSPPPSPILASSSSSTLLLAAASSLSSPSPPLQLPPSSTPNPPLLSSSASLPRSPLQLPPPPSSPTAPSSSPTPNRSSPSSSSSVHDGQSDPNATFPTAHSDVVTVHQHGKGTTGHEELLQTTEISTSARVQFKVFHPRGRPWSPVNAEVLVALSGMALLVMGGVAVASVLKRRRTRGQYKLVAGVAKVDTRA
ncbi:uncharacterized protein LOC133355440 [Lethenteron reissneri]|uniref:uncharacterized protein LOC133355440 n=1 Tax=Lethenteron reissneri TaxID=7753 RepID=UPI002AB6BFFF|nr:uncharacterized protein LOC133355440 [Lethenteron reissneri]